MNVRTALLFQPGLHFSKLVWLYDSCDYVMILRIEKRTGLSWICCWIFLKIKANVSIILSSETIQSWNVSRGFLKTAGFNDGPFTHYEKWWQCSLTSRLHVMPMVYYYIYFNTHLTCLTLSSARINEKVPVNVQRWKELRGTWNILPCRIERFFFFKDFITLSSGLRLER